jgi:hypothetical protein
MSVAGVPSNRSKRRQQKQWHKLELGTVRGPCIICLIHFPIKQDIINHESSVEQ